MLTPPASASSNYPALFLQAVERVLSNEGGYSSLPGDRGGATNFGISQRDYPMLDVRNLTREEVVAIYFRDFWQPDRYRDLPAPLAVKLFDLAVNMGPEHAIRCLQRALRSCGDAVLEDGVLGDLSVAAVKRAECFALLTALRSEAAGYYRATAAARAAHGQSEFLEGWLNRAYQ